MNAHIFFSFFQETNQYLKANPHLALSLRFDDHDRFECSRCAQCCMLPWSVTVSQAYYERWNDFLQAHPSGLFPTPFIRLEGGSEQSYAQLSKQPGTHRCILLDDNNLCFMHREFGPTAKPEGCQQYPRLKSTISNGYIVSHLMESCRTAPLFLGEDAELIYEFVPRASVTWQTVTTLKLHGLHHVNKYVFHLWLGTIMDTLMLEGTASQNLMKAQRVLDRIYRELNAQPSPEAEGNGDPRDSSISEMRMVGIYREYIQNAIHQAVPAGSEELKNHALYWFLNFAQTDEVFRTSLSFYQSIYEGKSHWPSLNADERKLLNNTLRNYLLRKTTNYYYWSIGKLTLFQEHFILAVYVLVIQMMALYSRAEDTTTVQLTLQHLRYAINMVESRMAQNQHWLTSNNILSMPPDKCLHDIPIFLALDWAAG